MLKRILYLIQKEFRQIFREKINLVIIFVMPFVQLVVLGLAITLDIKNIDLIIMDNDKSTQSTLLKDAFISTKTFRYLGEVNTEIEATKMLDKGRAKFAVIIPKNFAKKLNNNQPAPLMLLIDGVDGNSAGIATAYAYQIIMGFQQKIIKESLNKAIKNEQMKVLETEPGAKERAPQTYSEILRGASDTGNNAMFSKTNLYKQVQLVPKMLYNPDLNSTFNIIPGILAMLLTMITMFLTAINIVKEKENGTLEQLMVTPIQSSELIIGKSLPFMILGFILLNVGILSSGLIFGIWLKGNLWLFYGLSLIYLCTSLGLGILFSTIAQTQLQAMLMSLFYALFSILLSGFFIPISNMPDIIQYFTYLMPLKYFMEITRGLFLKASPASALLPEIFALIIFGILTLGFAIIKFKKRIS